MRADVPFRQNTCHLLSMGANVDFDRWHLADIWKNYAACTQIPPHKLFDEANPWNVGSASLLSPSNIENTEGHLSHATKYFSTLNRGYFLHFPGRSTPCRIFFHCLHEVWWQDQHHLASSLSYTSFHSDSNWSADDVSMCAMLGVTFVIIISRKNKCRATGAPGGGNQKMTTWPWRLQSVLRRVVAWHTMCKPSLLLQESQYSLHNLHYADSLLRVG